MYLSVIIPTRNRASILTEALKSIETQTLPNDEFEVLVVDNASTDNTADIVAQFKDRIENLRYLYEPKSGLHAGRHNALKNSSTDILVYADDDIRAFPTWLTAIKNTFNQNPDVVLVGGKNLPDYEVDPPAWVLKLWEQCEFGKCLGYYSVLDFGDDVKEISPSYVWGCNFSIRKSALVTLRGFHPDGMPKERLAYRGDGETAVSAAIEEKGWKTLYNPQASVYHLVSARRMTLEYIYERAFAQGVSNSFGDIRRCGGVTDRDNSHAEDSLGILAPLKNIMRKWYRMLQGQYDAQTDLAQQVVIKGLKDGYAFHQREARQRPDVLAWVLRSDYLDV